MPARLPACPPCRGLSEVDRLGTVERYFVEVKDIPRLAERIRCFIFSRTYTATHARVSGWAELWGAASPVLPCRQLLMGARGPGVGLVLRLGSGTALPQPSCHACCAVPAALPGCLQCVDQLEVMRSACRELQGCSAFSKLLQAVLELGNHLNQVGARSDEFELLL